MNFIRLSDNERKALNKSLEDFEGDVFLFGSRLDKDKHGGDIDILLKPYVNVSRYALKSRIIARFERVLQQSLDVVVYDEHSVFCQEILKYAKPIDRTSL